MPITHGFYVSMNEPIPVSSNNLYATVRGMRVMTREGRAFKDALSAIVAEHIAALSWKDAIDAVYVRGGHARLYVSLHLPIRNKSYKAGAQTKKGGLQSPYKKKDASSYLKAIEDAVAEATGIDDSCQMRTAVEKSHSDKPWIEISYEIMEGE